jgi:hypothetical protein
VEATKKSASVALQVAEKVKYILLKSFTISKTIIPSVIVKDVKRSVRVPEVQEFANLTIKELRNLTNLTIKKVKWNKDFFSRRFTISNGESCTAGSQHENDKSHTFDPNKKITKVKVVIQFEESCII